LFSAPMSIDLPYDIAAFLVGIVLVVMAIAQWRKDRTTRAPEDLLNRRLQPLTSLGSFMSGLDISHTFVKIAGQNAREAGVTANFHQGDAAVMPFEAESFDLIVCQAAFKNFVHPGSALSEMHRVLRGGGTALIQDMSSDATHADIERKVKGMELGWVSSFTTKATLEMLKRRAYSPRQFERLVAESPFKTCAITTEGIGLEVRLEKPVA
jgi:SAM-dependent methyltransferase